MKKMLLALIAATLLTLGVVQAAESTAPKSVIHVVTVTWKEGTTPEQITAALEGAKALPAAYKGITKVWTKTIKAQGERNFVRCDLDKNGRIDTAECRQALQRK